MNDRTVPRHEGRLLDPGMSMGTDPRIDPRLRQVMIEYGLADNPPPLTVSRSGNKDEIIAVVKGAHEAFNGFYEALPNDLPGDTDIPFTQHEVTGVNGNSIIVRVYREPSTAATAPGVIYYHGGGMTVLDAFSKVHTRWTQDLAASGMVAIVVEFRNAWTEERLNPFPAGLNDCLSAAKWVSDRRADLGISKLILQGESGGGNLALATALKALSEGCIDIIDGVYACVPYISGAYAWSRDDKLSVLPSLVENDGYFLEMTQTDVVSEMYDPGGRNLGNPLCWPCFAEASALRGLPPHVISVNELDPLRDEGIHYYRQLLRAGVQARGRVNLGMAHAAEMIFRKYVPDVYFATIRDIADFSRSV